MTDRNRHDLEHLAADVSAADLPNGGQIIVASSQVTSQRRAFITALSRRFGDDTITIVDAGVSGEWQAGDDGRADDDTDAETAVPPRFGILLIHHDCPHGHSQRLAEKFMVASEALVLDVLTLPENP